MTHNPIPFLRLIATVGGESHKVRLHEVGPHLELAVEEPGRWGCVELSLNDVVDLIEALNEWREHTERSSDA